MSGLRSLRAEDGFSILESTVALVIIFGVVLTMMRTLDSGIRVLVETRRQAAASAFANELLERARSLEWKHTGLTADSNDADCPGTGDGIDGVGCSQWKSEFGVGGDGTSGNPYTFESDVVVFTNGQTFDPFLSFHEQVTRDNTVFDRYLFVTSIRDDPTDPTTERYRKLTAIVQWTPPAGFLKEVRQTTYVARFEVPSVPFLKGAVDFDGGHLAIGGTQPEGRGFVAGSERWTVGGVARPDLAATIELPDAQVSATTDWVTGAVGLAIGMIGQLDWSDGTASTVGPDRFEKRADDDFGSLPPPNDPLATYSLPAWDAGGAAPYDLLAREETDSWGALDDTTGNAQAWTELSPGDLLPYGSVLLEAAEAVSVGFLEYSGAVENRLESNGIVSDLDGNPYRFLFVRHGAASGPTLAYDGTADRQFPLTDTRRSVLVDAVWGGEEVYLGHDTAYAQAVSSNFKGWVRIVLPDIDTDLHVGGTSSPLPSDMATGNLRVSYWDHATGAYVDLFDQDYDGVASVQTLDLDANPGNGTFDPANPLVVSINVSNYPRLRYEVSAELTVNPMVTSESTNGLGERSDQVVQVPSIVAGTFNYRVEDEGVTASVLGDGLLFDVNLDVGLGGFNATARYLNPDAP